MSITDSTPETRMASLLAAHAVLSTVEHILSVSTDVQDARRQVRQYI